MALEDSFHVTLIDLKDYFEFTPSRLRTLVEPKHSSLIQVQYSKFLFHTNVVEDKVTFISTDFVQTQTNRVIDYDYLIICTGSRQRDPYFPTLSELQKMGPNHIPPEHAFHRTPSDIASGRPALPPAEVQITMPSPLVHRHTPRGPAVILTARADHLHQYHDIVAAAKRVLIVGGGTVGVELAAEIVEKFKTKEVCIVHCRPKLMDRSPSNARSYAETFFLRNGVTLLLNDRVEGHEGQLWKTKNGVFVEADVAFICTGNQPNTEMLQNAHFHKYINEKNGLVRVNEYLQLQDHPNIFVAGDLTDIPQYEEKLCQTAGREVNLVVRNIFRRERHQELVKYDPTDCPMCVSLGKYDGILTYKGFTLTGFVPAAVKEFIEWKELVFYWEMRRYGGMPSVELHHPQAFAV